ASRCAPTSDGNATGCSPPRDRKHSRAVHAGGHLVLWIGQHEADAECIAGCVEHLVDDGHGGNMNSPSRLTWTNLRLHALRNQRKGGYRQVDFNAERIDLGNLHDFRLLEDILSGRHDALDDVTVDWTDDRALGQEGGCALHLEDCKLLIGFCLAKLQDSLLQL